MRNLLPLVCVFAAISLEAAAQRNPKKEAAFVVAHPTIGDSLPNVTVLTPDGKPFDTADLRGHFAVLTFGCLT
jgi:cytochrome oxidase Cu insertion factor (SCO1/SenC/PrrC family)